MWWISALQTPGHAYHAALEAAYGQRVRLRNDSYEIEKRQVGELWAQNSGDKCVFCFVYLDDNGMDVQAQLDKVFR